MISYIRGTLAFFEEDKVVVDVGGVGYGIYMSGQDMSRLGPAGTEVRIHTYLNVKEDAMQLYGFLTRDALQVFRLLISVSGIGPKGGLGILSALTPDDLRFAVMAGDVKAIRRRRVPECRDTWEMSRMMRCRLWWRSAMEAQRR